MTTSTMARPAPSLGDRYAEISVILLTALALLLGWALRSAVESRSVPFEAEGISAQAPAGWLRGTGDGTALLRATDPASLGFRTTYVVATQPVAAGATEAQVASLLTLNRAQNLTAYRVLSQQAVTINGRSAHRLDFVYVESDPDLTRDQLPHVVRGVEFVFLDGDRAVLVAYHADEPVYEADFARFRRFLNSVSF